MKKQERDIARELAAHIIDACIKKTIETEEQVFVDYAAHVGWVKCHRYREGWSHGAEDEEFMTYVDDLGGKNSWWMKGKTLADYFKAERKRFNDWINS